MVTPTGVYSLQTYVFKRKHSSNSDTIRYTVQGASKPSGAKSGKEGIMKVYRLERKGIGPFVGRSPMVRTVSKKKYKRTMHVRRQATVKENWAETHYQAVKNKEYMFGAKTKELLKAYFGFTLKPMFAAGYKIKVYEVPDEEVLDMGLEVAFPVKYHKLKTVNRVKQQSRLA